MSGVTKRNVVDFDTLEAEVHKEKETTAKHTAHIELGSVGQNSTGDVFIELTPAVTAHCVSTYCR